MPNEETEIKNSLPKHKNVFVWIIIVFIFVGVAGLILFFNFLNKKDKIIIEDNVITPEEKQERLQELEDFVFSQNKENLSVEEQKTEEERINNFLNDQRIKDILSSDQEEDQFYSEYFGGVPDKEKQERLQELEDFVSSQN